MPMVTAFMMETMITLIVVLSKFYGLVFMLLQSKLLRPSLGRRCTLAAWPGDRKWDSILAGIFGLLPGEWPTRKTLRN